MKREELKLLIDEWQQKMHAATFNVRELQNLGTTQILVDIEGTLTGKTAAQVKAAFEAAKFIWEGFDLIQTQLDRAAELHQSIEGSWFPSGQTLRDIEALLTGETVELSPQLVPLSERDLVSSKAKVVCTSLDKLLQQLITVYAAKRDLVMHVGKAMTTLPERLLQVEKQIPEVMTQAEAVGGTAVSECVRIKETLQRLQAQSVTDPLGVMDEVESIETTLTETKKRYEQQAKRKRKERDSITGGASTSAPPVSKPEPQDPALGKVLAEQRDKPASTDSGDPALDAVLADRGKKVLVDTPPVPPTKPDAADPALDKVLSNRGTAPAVTSDSDPGLGDVLADRGKKTQPSLPVPPAKPDAVDPVLDKVLSDKRVKTPPADGSDTSDPALVDVLAHRKPAPATSAPGTPASDTGEDPSLAAVLKGQRKKDVPPADDQATDAELQARLKGKKKPDASKDAPAPATGKDTAPPAADKSPADKGGDTLEDRLKKKGTAGKPAEPAKTGASTTAPAGETATDPALGAVLKGRTKPAAGAEEQDKVADLLKKKKT